MPDAMWMSTVRTVAGDVAGRADLDMDAIADLRMAVDEACASLLGLADRTHPLRCVFSPGQDAVRVQVSVRARTSDAVVTTHGFGWRVLTTLVDEISVPPTGDGSTVRTIMLLKKGLPR